MGNYESVLKYSNGISALNQFIAGNIGAPKANVDLIKDIRNMRYSKVSLIALFFETKKEDMIEENVVGENTEYTSKMVDEALVSAIKIIAKKVGDKYILGTYESNNPFDIVAFIRNCFAHGRYHLDVENNKVIIDNKGYVFDIDIDKLYTFVFASCHDLMELPKTKKHVRYQSGNLDIRELPFEHIDNCGQIKKVIKQMTICKHSVTSMNDNYLDRNVLIYFNHLLAFRAKNLKDVFSVSQAIIDFKIYAHQKDANYSSTDITLRGKELEEVIEYVSNTVGFYDWPLVSQVNFISTTIYEKLVPEENGLGYLDGIFYNMIILDKMENDHNFDLSNIISGISMNFNNVLVEIVLTGLLAEFNTTYIYPLETRYTNDLKYSLNRENELDFSLLDLDFINPSYLEVKLPSFADYENTINSNFSEYKDLKKELEKTKLHLEKAKLKDSVKGIEMQTKNIENIQSSMVDACANIDNILKLKEAIKRDYKENEKYHRNKAIIIGLRNAIAHGHVKIKRFSGETDIEDNIIIFQDIYEGKVTFEVEMTLLEFERLVYSKNPMLYYLSTKDAFEEWKEREEERERISKLMPVKKEKVLTKIMKKVMNIFK